MDEVYGFMIYKTYDGPLDFRTMSKEVKRGDTEIRNLRAQVVTADKAAKDALFDEKMYDYKWMMDMGQITKGQYADYLEGLKSTLIPGTRQFKELELTIKQLKDDIGSDLQHNLPTSLALPTLYEQERFSFNGSVIFEGQRDDMLGVS